MVFVSLRVLDVFPAAPRCPWCPRPPAAPKGIVDSTDVVARTGAEPDAARAHWWQSQDMKSTMQSAPLLISSLLRFGTTMHGDSEVVTWTSDGARRTSYRELGRQAAQLAHALRGLGVTGDQRVGTFMWNNQEHLEAYLAVPAMGAVLHTLNVRLFPDQLAYIIDHAQDLVVLADGSVLPLLAKVLGQTPSVKHVVVNG